MASTFGKAFAREFGKNSAKLVSNALFRNHWATPYRRVASSNRRYRDPIIRQSKVTIEPELQSNDEFSLMQIIAAKKQDEKERTNQLLALDEAVINNIDKLSDLPIPRDLQGINALLGKLSIKMRSVNLEDEGDDNKDGKIRNKYLTALIEKYDQALFELQSLNPTDPHIPKYATLYLSRHKEVLHHQTLNSLKKMLLPFPLAFLAGVSILGGYYGGLSDGSWDETPAVPFLLVIFLVALIVSAILIVVLKTMKMNKVLAEEKAKYIVTASELKKEEIAGNSLVVPKTVDDVSSVELQPESKINFFDLNEDNRIGRKLAVLWDKYAGKVPSKFLARKPIFAADGVKDSILFVGINPDYSADDDNKFLLNEDGKSLLYGSFYGRDDAPGYFKALELFASHFGKTYTQMNLLYVRENNRDELMMIDSNFIREQLELSYDTIVKIQPKAVVFFTTYCKNLIFGKSRWVDPATLLNGHYTLNGTSIPVFFSEDVTVLDEEMLGNLADDLRSALS